MSSFKYCPLCQDGITVKQKDGNYYITCHCQELISNDSTYVMSDTVYDDHFSQNNPIARFNSSGYNIENNKEQLMLLRYYHTKAQQRNPHEKIIINSNFIARIEKQSLPSIVEQLDNLILWCGEYGKKHKNLIGEFSSHGHIIGSRDKDMFYAVITEAKNREYLSGNTLNLTFNGQLKYEELSRGALKGHGAFMAMKFNNTELDTTFVNCFVPAAYATGFNLKKLNDEPKAGLIDNRLRQEIRLARFIIADLTHGNNGAYWEAGYAEGLGKPVIYTCEKSEFETGKIHFDTNHHQTIIWNKENLKKAEDELKATIRCTIPEAKQRDEN